MKVLLQRVSEASVSVEGERVGAIGRGLLLLVGLDATDTDAELEKLAKKVLDYRVFPDEAGKMNRCVTDVAGQLLVVSQFTLSADCRKGNRPSFTTAMPPEQAEPTFQRFVTTLKQLAPALTIETGRFGATMRVSLVNEGPVTFLLQA